MEMQKTYSIENDDPRKILAERKIKQIGVYAYRKFNGRCVKGH